MALMPGNLFPAVVDDHGKAGELYSHRMIDVLAGDRVKVPVDQDVIGTGDGGNAHIFHIGGDILDRDELGQLVGPEEIVPGALSVLPEGRKIDGLIDAVLEPLAVVVKVLEGVKFILPGFQETFNELDRELNAAFGLGMAHWSGVYGHAEPAHEALKALVVPDAGAIVGDNGGLEVIAYHDLGHTAAQIHDKAADGVTDGLGVLGPDEDGPGVVAGREGEHHGVNQYGM